MNPAVAARRHRQARRLRLLLVAGVIDSTGLAFGWTVFLLAVTERHGMSAAALQTSAMLLGVALSAPVSGFLAGRLSAQHALRLLAVLEGCCRLGLIALLVLDAPAITLAVLVALTNVLAWTAFAAMRSEVSRVDRAGSGRALTAYAAAIGGSEALAAALASVLIGDRPSTSVLVGTAVVYAGALLPQWLAAGRAERHAVASSPVRAARAAWAACGVGAVTMALTGGPALLATVLAYRMYGTAGVAVSAACFAVGALGAPRLQSVIDRRQVLPAAFGVGALLAGGWALAGWHLIGLGIAQLAAGVAQCSLEGDLDARAVSRLGAGEQAAGLSLAAAARSLGGALAVALLPSALSRSTLPAVAGGLAGLSLAVGLVAALAPRRPRPAVIPTQRRPHEIHPVLPAGEHIWSAEPAPMPA